VQSEVCICNKVSVSADRLSTDRYEQLSNREELLALVSALAGNGAVLEVVPTLDRIDPGDVAGIPVAHTHNLLIRIISVHLQ
jgi:hypothetical protein